MEIIVTIKAPELANAINVLADAIYDQTNAKRELAGLAAKSFKPAAVEAEGPAPAAAMEAPKETPAAGQAQTETPQAARLAPAVSLESVRAKLAELTKAGKSAQAKELIARFGGTKLTEIPADRYGDLMAAVEAIA